MSSTLNPTKFHRQTLRADDIVTSVIMVSAIIIVVVVVVVVVIIVVVVVIPIVNVFNQDTISSFGRTEFRLADENLKPARQLRLELERLVEDYSY